MAAASRLPKLVVAAWALAVIALWLLAAGLFLPIMTVRQAFFLNETFTIAGMIARLFEDGQPLLAAVVFAFSVVFPVGKLAIVLMATDKALALGQRLKLAKVAEFIGKWSMLDVFVVAISIVTIKATGFATVFDHPGVYLFGAAVMLSMVASVALKRGLSLIAADDPPVERVIPRHWYG